MKSYCLLSDTQDEDILSFMAGKDVIEKLIEFANDHELLDGIVDKALVCTLSNFTSSSQDEIMQKLLFHGVIDTFH